MDKIFIKQIKENDRIDSIFLVKEKNLATSKGGKPYLALTLMDRTGEIDARVWDDAESVSGRFDQGDFVRVHSRVQRYQGRLQLIVSALDRIDPSEVMVDEFMPSIEGNIEKLFARLKELCAEIKDAHLHALVGLFLSDEAFVRDFKMAPAAKALHHVAIGGLLEHTVSVCELIQKVADHYKGIDKNLLLAAGVLHDVGKVHELSYRRMIDYTDQGRLIGHVVLGVEMIDERLRELPGFPSELAMLLKHLVLTHHGYLEYGSPKRPKTLEALLLHYLDDMDAKMNGFKQFMDREGRPGSRWTPFHKVFDRYLYRDSGTSGSGSGEE